MNECVWQYDNEDRKIFLPSEIWITDEPDVCLRASDDPFDFGEGLNLRQSDWNDQEIKEIMKGRGSKVSCEYLSRVGQHLRHEFVEGIIKII